jgi:tRNA (cmo5U34)-methyltransferase
VAYQLKHCTELTPQSIFMNKHDNLFLKEEKAEDFRFGKSVVSVFDDMVNRSVPFYAEIQRMIAEIAKDFAQPGTNVYDLGCSTGTTLLNIDKILPGDIRFVGVDDSRDMLAQCKTNFEEHNVERIYKLQQSDLNQGIRIENASVVIMCLTLQFIRPLYREHLLKNLHDQMPENSCLILVEKVLGEDSLFNRLFIKYYYDFKRKNDYNDLEISRKREALENILIPYKLKENHELLASSGFRYIETFFKWYNFSGMVAVK